MWVWDAGAPQLAIGVPRTGILPHVRIAYLSYTTAFPLCCFTHIHSRSTWLCAVKRVPCHVLEPRTPHVMDGRVVSRGLCFTLGNPGLQPSCLAMVDAASLVHVVWRPSAHPVTSPSNIGHKLILSSPPSGSRISWHDNTFSNIFALFRYHHPLRYCFDHRRAKPSSLTSRDLNLETFNPTLN
jgi:hypothetical protein